MEKNTQKPIVHGKRPKSTFFEKKTTPRSSANKNEASRHGKKKKNFCVFFRYF
jgi:hypothetical protein